VKSSFSPGLEKPKTSERRHGLPFPATFVVLGLVTLATFNAVRSSNWFNRPDHDDSFLTVDAHSRLSSLAFSPDGRLIATAGNDYLVRIWEAHSGRELRALRGHTDHRFRASPSARMVAGSCRAAEMRPRGSGIRQRAEKYTPFEAIAIASWLLRSVPTDRLSRRAAATVGSSSGTRGRFVNARVAVVRAKGLASCAASLSELEAASSHSETGSGLSASGTTKPVTCTSWDTFMKRRVK
jgi:WD domain, G-beta repeat